MNLERLEYFAAVAENLNFTRAAEDCHVAQTAISRHIAALESEVGCKLFYRTNRAVELTPAGKAFYSEILPMLEHYRRALEKAPRPCAWESASSRWGLCPSSSKNSTASSRTSACPSANIPTRS